MSAVTIHNRVHAGEFPKPDDVNGRKRLWNVGTVNGWAKSNKKTITAMQTRSNRFGSKKAAKATKAKKKQAA